MILSEIILLFAFLVYSFRERTFKRPNTESENNFVGQFEFLYAFFGCFKFFNPLNRNARGI